MNLSAMTEDKKNEMLQTLNDHWQQQTKLPRGQEFIPATRILDTYDHRSRLRVVLKTEAGTRLMFVNKEIFGDSE